MEGLKKMIQPLVNIIRDEAKELSEKTGKMPYFSKPYPCAIEECLNYFDDFGLTPEDRMTIERLETSTIISLKPRKGSGKRKLYVIKIWVA
jgi:hypothetical protein